MAKNGTEVTVARIPPCDISPEHGPAYADAKLSIGPWAYVCLACFELYQCELGTGRGQKLVRKGSPDD